MFHNGDESSDMSECFFTKYFFVLLVTPNIPPVSGNNDAIKRLSSARYFS